MSERRFQLPNEWSGFKSYVAETKNVGMEFLCPPSLNCIIRDDGGVESRKGFEDSLWNLDVANKPMRPYYMKKYDITFFAGGAKLKYVDHNNNNAVVDTGVTLTDGTVTRFDSYLGDVYLTNQTNGVNRIVVMRLNGATTAGGNITVDEDGAARLSVFGDATGNLRINGTNEAFSAVTVSGGVLTATASASYADNTVAIFVDALASLEKGSKVFFWKERMGIFGSLIAANADQPNNNIYFGKFTIGNTGSTSMEDIINFTYGTGGSTREVVGKGGRVTNVLPTEDYLYIFTEGESYIVSEMGVVVSGDGIGRSTPDLRSPIHGCVNEDSAIDMGNGEVAFITGDNRIMRIKISTESGAPVVFPDESFDVPIRDLLKNMDDNQAGAFAFYHRGNRQAIFQVKIDAEWVTLIFDNNIRAWQAPQKGKSMSAYFERNGVLYGCASGDDTIYVMDSSYNDDGQHIEVYICSGDIDVDDSFIESLELKGSISQPTSFSTEVIMDDGTTEPRVIQGSEFSYPSGGELGAIESGSMLGGSTEDTDRANFKKNLDVYPCEGNKVKIKTYCIGDSQYYAIDRWTLHGRRFSDSFTPLS